jgi:hypothetical protein
MMMLNLAGWLLVVGVLAAFASGDFLMAAVLLIGAAVIALGLEEL